MLFIQDSGSNRRFFDLLPTAQARSVLACPRENGVLDHMPEFGDELLSLRKDKFAGEGIPHNNFAARSERSSLTSLRVLAVQTQLRGGDLSLPLYLTLQVQN